MFRSEFTSSKRHCKPAQEIQKKCRLAMTKWHSREQLVSGRSRERSFCKQRCADHLARSFQCNHWLAAESALVSTNFAVRLSKPIVEPTSERIVFHFYLSSLWTPLQLDGINSRR